jgi:3-isopropylmalate/(R)-2-methylmalate dehydratase small subunit
MNPFKTLTSHVVVVPVDNIDTDQIIPARYLKATTKTGLGDGLFSNWRYLPDGTANPEFALNRPESQGSAILLAGDNFGCGSSREHAPWALTAYGFRAVISTSFADIFRNNSLKNGLLPVILTPPDYQALVTALSANPRAELTIDLDEQAVVLPDGRVFGFPIDDFSKTCLINGVDELGYLINLEPDIARFEQARQAF